MGLVKGVSQILLRNYFFECLECPYISTFETLPQEVSVSPLDNYYYTLFSLKKQDGKIAKSKGKKNNFFVHFAGCPGS